MHGAAEGRLRAGLGDRSDTDAIDSGLTLRTIHRFVWLALIFTTGCDDSGMNLAPVEGVVTLEGAPVAEAGVMFVPNDSSLGPPATGATDADGRFSLITANRAGALVGDHRVVISKDEVVTIPQRHGLPIYRTRYLIPPKYGSVDTSGLTATVIDDDNEFEFKLSAK
ncbi:MAG TPA: hypothetical protein VH681_07565 [Nitrospiraceae bacterium]|jgi:hypothetical protein